jgi:thioester reductase-like protein
VAVVVTGATGFLGSHLLMGLLDDDRRVTVLNHASRTTEAPIQRLDRLFRHAGKSRNLRDRLRTHVRYVTGDLGKPQLGLPPDEYRLLADEVDELWHCAASITLRGDSQRPHRINVDGGRRILDLVGITDRPVRIFVIGTVFAAGLQQEGVVTESPFPDIYGVHNTYEQSKRTWETMVHRWSVATHRAVTIFRTSALITDRPCHPDDPSHNLLALVRRTLGAVRQLPADAPVVHRWPVDPLGLYNLLPVEYAADVMLRAARLPPLSPTGIVHVVHPTDVAVHNIRHAVEQATGLRIRPVPDYPRHPHPHETAVYNEIRPFLPYLAMRVRYLRRHLDDAGFAAAACPPIEPEYLTSSLTPPYRMEL